MVNARKLIKDYITANGASTAAALIEDGVLKGDLPDRVESIIEKMTARGKLIESGGNYSLPV